MGTFFDMRIRHMFCPASGLRCFHSSSLCWRLWGQVQETCAHLKTLKVFFCVFFGNLHCFTFHIYIPGSSEVRVVCPLSHTQAATVFHRDWGLQLHFPVCPLQTRPACEGPSAPGHQSTFQLLFSFCHTLFWSMLKFFSLIVFLPNHLGYFCSFCIFVWISRQNRKPC